MWTFSYKIQITVGFFCLFVCFLFFVVVVCFFFLVSLSCMMAAQNLFFFFFFLVDRPLFIGLFFCLRLFSLIYNSK